MLWSQTEVFNVFFSYVVTSLWSQTEAFSVSSLGYVVTSLWSEHGRLCVCVRHKIRSGVAKVNIRINITVVFQQALKTIKKIISKFWKVLFYSFIENCCIVKTYVIAWNNDLVLKLTCEPSTRVISGSVSDVAYKMALPDNYTGSDFWCRKWQDKTAI